MEYRLLEYTLQNDGLRGKVLLCFLENKIDNKAKSINARDILLNITDNKNSYSVAMLYKVLKQLSDDSVLIKSFKDNITCYHLASSYLVDIKNYNKLSAKRIKCKPLKYTDIMQKSS